MHRSYASNCARAQGRTRCQHSRAYNCACQEVELTKAVVVAAAILRADGSLLAARRIGKSAGFWELPGGKVEVGESPLDALSREIFEELGVHISFDEPQAVEVGNGFDIDADHILRVYKCALTDGSEIPVVNGSHDEIRWLAVDEWLDVEWLPVDREGVLFLRSAALLTIPIHRQ